MKTRGEEASWKLGAASRRSQLALPDRWTEAQQRGIPITDVARWMSEQPAKLAGLDHRKGAIRDGQ